MTITYYIQFNNNHRVNFKIFYKLWMKIFKIIFKSMILQKKFKKIQIYIRVIGKFKFNIYVH